MSRPKPAIATARAASTTTGLRLRPLAVAAALFGSSTAFLVQAQEAQTPSPEAVATTEGVVLENVQVTATRRDAGVQDIPINITAVTSADIARQGLTDLSDLAATVPGLFLVDQGGRDGNRIVVRGLNVSSLASSEATGNSTGGVVATYVGDIPLYLDLKLMDIERVEVLLGPQGTLYGAGTLGGAIRYLPNRPKTNRATLSTSQEFYGLSESAGLGSETIVTGNLPLTDKAAVRASVGYYFSPGFIDNNFLVRTPGVSDPEPNFADPAAVAANLRRERDIDTERTLAARVGLLYQFTDKLDANLTYFYQDQRIGGRTINHQDSLGTGEYESASRFDEPNDRDNQLLTLEVDWDLGFGKLTSASGISRYEELGQRDQTDLLLDFEYGYEDFPAFAAFTKETGKQDRISQEVRLVSTSEGPFNWIVGGFYNEAKSKFTSSEFAPGIPEFFGVDRPDNLEYFQTSDDTFTEKALFGELGYQFTDRWQVTLGARFFEFEDDLTQGIAFPLVDGSGPNEVLPEFQSNAISDSDSLFKANTSYQFSKAILGYATLSEGYRSGGVNPLPNCPDPLPANQFACVQPGEALIKPDTTLNYELGLRTSWLKGRLVVNGALYYIDWKDIQVAGSTEVGNVPITVNAAQAVSQGLELSVQGLVTRNWRINGSYTYTKAELDQDAPGIVGGEDAFKGDRLPGSPEHQGNVFITYTQKLSNGATANLDYGVRAVGNVLTRTGSRDNGESLPGYVVHRASASYLNRGWTARVYAENLFDRYVETGVRGDRSFVRAIDSDGESDNGDGFKLRSYYKDVLEPLKVGATVRYDFKF